MTPDEFNELKNTAYSISRMANEIGALFRYNRINMLEPNKVRLRCDIDSAIRDLETLKEKLAVHGLYPSK